MATDILAKLAGKLVSGEEKMEGMNGIERLDFVLKTLNVPVESQVLVFSKTSLQNGLIHPKNPRSLYFSEDAYVGYVPGGDIEAIVQDSVLGPVYYLIGSHHEKGLEIERDTSNCLSCHGTGRTEGVPGMLIRSVYPDEDGHPLLQLGTTDVDQTTPLEERWGGWYVTGRSSIPHLGNRVFSEDGDREPEEGFLEDIGGVIDAGKYPVATSDIVALMVLEHQCKAHTLINAAALQLSPSLSFYENRESGW